MRQTLILDSSQISAHEECPTIWQNRDIILIDKLNPSETNTPNEKIAAGSLGHKYLEIYYTVLAETRGNSGIAAKSALALDPDKADSFDTRFPLDQMLRDKVKKRFIDYMMYYSPDRDFTIAHKYKHTIDTCGEQLVTKSEIDPMIEKGFSFQLLNTTEYLFILEGRIDFVGYAKDGTVLWMDHKWQFREHNLYAKDIQFKNYSLATGLNMAVINYIRLHDKICDTTFVRQPLSFSTRDMRYWKEELIEIYIRIAREVRLGEFPRNWNSCAGSWGKVCQFAPLCEEHNPEIREHIRKRDYTDRMKWRPWIDPEAPQN